MRDIIASIIHESNGDFVSECVFENGYDTSIFIGYNIDNKLEMSKKELNITLAEIKLSLAGYQVNYHDSNIKKINKLKMSQSENCNYRDGSYIIINNNNFIFSAKQDFNKLNSNYDNDLYFVLEKASNEELDILVSFFKNKFSESLTSELLYQMCWPNHIKYPHLITNEICLYGGNTFVNLFRGGGPSYKAIVCEVAKKYKAPFNKNQSIETIEQSILSTIINKAFENMSEKEQAEFLKEFGFSNKSAIKGGSIAAFQAIFKAGGFKSYQLSIIIVNSILKAVIGKGLPFKYGPILMKSLKLFTNPIFTALSTLWMVWDLAGPSYKVIMPAVPYIAMLRIKYSSDICLECEATLPSGGCKFCPECGKEIQPEKKQHLTVIEGGRNSA